mmetsp:Transcript_19914/g.51980  ORF Transcript_19914/g.51980 Transcript_19914/m.51980 type:complete len:235 (+) Transcript_19914:127-831(+)
MTPALQLTHGAARHWECTCNRIHQTCCFLCWRHRKGNNHSQMGKWCGVQRPISDDMVVCQYPHLLCLCLGPSRERKSKDNVHQQPARAEHQGEEEAGEEKNIWHAACGGVHANPAPYHQVEAHVVHPAKQHHVALGECLHQAIQRLKCLQAKVLQLALHRHGREDRHVHQACHYRHKHGKLLRQLAFGHQRERYPSRETQVLEHQQLVVCVREAVYRHPVENTAEALPEALGWG